MKNWVDFFHDVMVLICQNSFNQEYKMSYLQDICLVKNTNLVTGMSHFPTDICIISLLSGR